MRLFRAITLIAFCAFVLLVNDSNAAVSILKKYLPVLLRNPLKQLKNLRYGIVPGTLWCGPGSIASNYSELGPNWMLDTCCRAHDSCNEHIAPRENRYGLYNSARVCRRMLCECDSQFYNCLKKVSGIIAFYVGKIYFRNCKRCVNVYYNIESCIERNLDVSEEVGRNGSRVFCAQFDRNPKWVRPKFPMPDLISTTVSPTWIDNEIEQNISLSYPMDDEDDDEDYENYDDIPDIDTRMLNIY